MRLNRKERKDLLWALEHAIDGQKWVLLKWQAEYGSTYPEDLRLSRIAEIKADIDKLRRMKKEMT